MRNVHPSILAATLLSSAASLLLSGCGLAGSGTAVKTTTPLTGAVSVTGHVHGGNQPVNGAVINMYAVGASGYGSASVSVLNAGVTVKSANDGYGSFSLAGLYSCTPDQLIYITATGGDAGSGPNGALAEMAAVGRCADLPSVTVNINEITTVASVWALSPFMKGITNIGAPLSNTAGLKNAFADVNTLTSIAGGTAGGASLPAGTTIPVAAINTLADILASCVNTDGSNGAGAPNAPCTTLFNAATAGGVTPGDTVTAALNIAQHPATGVSTIYPLATPQSPFQPTLKDQPSDFTLAVSFAPGLSSPSSVSADASGNVWVTDASGNTLTELSHAGATVLTVPGLSTPVASAVDQAGNVWVANSGNSTVAKVIATTATLSTFSGGGLAQPRSISIDGQGNAWLANGASSTVSEFATDGTPLSGAGFTSASGAPLAIAVNPN